MLVYDYEHENIKQKYTCDKCSRKASIKELHEIAIKEYEWQLCELCTQKLIELIKEM